MVSVSVRVERPPCSVEQVLIRPERPPAADAWHGCRSSIGRDDPSGPGTYDTAGCAGSYAHCRRLV